MLRQGSRVWDKKQNSRDQNWELESKTGLHSNRWIAFWLSNTVDTWLDFNILRNKGFSCCHSFFGVFSSHGHRNGIVPSNYMHWFLLEKGENPLIFGIYCRLSMEANSMEITPVVSSKEKEIDKLEGENWFPFK